MRTKKVMYADVINGVFDMTMEDVIKLVKENPFFTDPEEVFIEGTDGTTYTGYDLLEMAGVKNQYEDEI